MTGFCPACGAQLALEGKFCPGCGEAAPPTPQPLSSAPASPDDEATVGDLLRDNISSGRFINNLFSLRRMGEGVLVWLIVGVVVGLSPTVAMISGATWWVVSSLANDSPLDCPHCGKAVKYSASVCHHCGREVA